MTGEHKINAQDIILRVDGLSKLYGVNRSEAVKLLEGGADKNTVFKKTGVTTALWDVNFQVRRGEVFVIIGLSGSGKSTVIRHINMLQRPTSGKIVFENSEISTFSHQELLEYRRNKVSMVFQNFGLMDHRDVLGNVAYGLEVKGVPRTEREKTALGIISMVGLEGHEHTPITSLSGGMKQRVGIARALCNDPEILLMDEPFSALDPLVRKDMQFELLSIQRKLEKTVVFITHDINEAFKLGDRVAIMRDGRLIQVGTPEEMSAHPADDYVRQFIESADKTKVMGVQQIMSRPCIIREGDTPAHAIREMRTGEVSTAYVVGKRMLLLGIIDISTAVNAARDGAVDLVGRYMTDVRTTGPDAMISDVMPLAAEARYPVPVVDEEGALMGVVTKASVLAALM